MATPLRRVAVSLVLGGGLLAVSWWFRLFYCWGASYDRNPIAARLEMLLCNLWLVASCVLIYCLIAAILFVARSIGRHAESGMAEKDIQVQPPSSYRLPVSIAMLLTALALLAAALDSC